MRDAPGTESFYCKILWDIVWKDAQEKTDKRCTPTAILDEFAAKIGMSAVHLRRYADGESFKMRKSTIKNLLSQTKFKDFDEFKDYVDLEERKKGTIDQWLNDILSGNQFLTDVYHLLASSPILSSGEGSLNHDQTVLFFKLVGGIKNTYRTEQIFTSLHLVADNGGVFGNLPMEDYFIQLSYVTQMELKTRESIIRSETEINKRKLQRSLENCSQLTKDYIINFSLQNVDNVLILGSPGIGKSTFSRWVSHAWANNPNILGGKIPIYIQLKGLVFNNAVNPIVDYVLKNYLVDEIASTGIMHGLLRKASSIVCFILDGYDELSEKSKENLFYRLQEISSNAKYIVTSRPYGILNTYNMRWSQMIQLDGFDMSNINNYIDVFLKKNSHKRKTKDKLLEIIRTNPILTDFSHNPLMLSFIVYIYLADDQVEETFRKIQTRFDLQEIVISWMHSHNKQKTSVNMNKYFVDNVSSLAYDMEMDKIPEISGSVYDQKVASLLVPISRLGIGQYTLESAHSFKFSFSSITFQEYFAAIHIGNLITPRAFSYLLQDSYYWNLTAMLVGKLNREANYIALNKLLEDCKKEILQHRSYYSYYKYLLLLGECGSTYLNNYLQSSSLFAIYTAYKLNINNDRIKYSVTEYIQRFYRKISSENKKEFKEYIIADLKKAADREMINWRGTDPYYYVRTLISDLSLAEDYDFSEACFGILIAVLKKIAKGKEKYLKMINAFEIPRLPEAILSMLKNIGENSIIPAKFSEQIKAVRKLLLIHHLTHKAEIELLLHPNVDEVISKLENSIGRIKKTANNDEAVGDIATCMFLLGRYHGAIATSKNVKKYVELLPLAIQIIQQFAINANKLDRGGNLRGKYNEWYYISFVDQVAQLTVTGLLAQTDSIDCFKAALDILSELSYSTRTFNIDQVSANFEKLLTNTSDEAFAQNLKYIHLSLLYVPALKNKIATYRSKLFDLVNKFIDAHQEYFKSDEIVEHVDGKPDPMDVIDPFFLILNSDRYSTTEIIYESDKRFFVMRLIAEGKGDYKYFRSVLPDIIDYDFILYDLSIWNYVVQYFEPNEKEMIENGLRIYANPSIYQYTSNVEHLITFLDFLISIESMPYYKVILKECSDSVFSIAAKALLMVKINKGINGDQKEKIIYLIGRIMMHRSILRQYRKNYADALLAAMLQYYFTKDMQYCQLAQYCDSCDNCELIENVYSAFRLPNDVALIQKFGGKKFVDEVRDYHEQIKVYHFPFVRSKFESICAGK